MRSQALWTVPLIALVSLTMLAAPTGGPSSAIFGAKAAAPASTVHSSAAGQGLQPVGKTPSEGLITPVSTERPYWVGGQTTGEYGFPNMGVKAMINVVWQPVQGCLSFWISDDSAADIWGQVGYALCNDSGPFGFFQVWNLTSWSMLTTETVAVAPGWHEFSMHHQSGTSWAFEIDMKVIGVYDMGAQSSKSGHPVYFVSEEEGTESPWNPQAVGLNGTSILGADGWYRVSSVYSYGTSWGVAGSVQSPLIPPGSMVIGGDSLVLPPGSALWSSSD